MTAPPLRVLLMDDTPGCLETIGAHLTEADDRIVVVRAASRAEFERLLPSSIQAVLCPTTLADFSIRQAMAILRERRLGIPLIALVEEHDDEDIADALRQGAVDAVSKRRPARLLPALQRALAQHQEVGDLRLSEEPYQDLFMLSSDGIILSDAQGPRLINPAARRILGLDAGEEIIGHDLSRHIPQIHAICAEHLSCSALDLIVEPTEVAVTQAHGTRIDIDILCQKFPRFGDQGWQLIMRSLIPRRKLDNQLRQLERAISSAANGIIITDATHPDNPIIYANPASERLTGYSRRELLGLNPRILQGSDRDQPDVVLLAQAVKNGRECTVTLRNYRKNGELFWNEMRIAPVRNANGELINYIGIQNDVTGARDAQAQLQRSEQRHRELIALLPDAIFINSGGIFTFCNPAGVILLGATSAKDIIGLSVTKVVHPDFLAKAKERLHRITVQKEKTSAELRWIRCDGREIDVQVTSAPTLHEGQPAALIIVHDITLRKAHERQLRNAYSEAELLLSSLSAILIGLDSQGFITRWNEQAQQVFGLTATDVRGRTLENCGMQMDLGGLLQSIDRCRAEGNAIEIGDIRFTRADGKPGFLSFSISATVMASASGAEEAGLVLLGRDITAHKIAESQKGQSQKMESIGQLAAGIAHEINTPIQFVGDNSRFLADAFTDLGRILVGHGKLVESVRGSTEAAIATCIAEVDAAVSSADLGYLLTEIPKAIDQSLQGVQRVADIVRAMKEFSHPDASSKQPADLNKALETTLTVARNEYRYVAEISTAFDPQLPMVPCVIGELNQVFLNLIVNAAHAIGDVVGNTAAKGMISVATARSGEWVKLSISDTGSGIPDSIRDRIFEPFFTTKGVGKGTGQGLYLAHAIIVKKHAGRIAFESVPGHGTTFTVLLPLHDQESM